MAYFATGFQTVAQLLLTVSGGITAVAVFLAAVLLITCLAGLIFDQITQAVAQRWEKKGRRPKGKLGRIIQEHHSRQRQ